MFPLKDDVPTNSTPFVTVGLIAINVLVFLYQVSLQGLASAEGSRAAQAFVLEFGLVPCRLTGHCVSPEGFPPPVVSMFTSMFLHGGLFHVAGNMLYLWIFGDNLEKVMGHARFLLFYLVCGIAAALALHLIRPFRNCTANHSPRTMTAGIRTSRMKKPKTMRVKTLARGKRRRYAPSTPETAPLAPIIGTVDSGPKPVCPRAAPTPEAR